MADELTLEQLRKNVELAKKSFDPIALDWWRYQLARRENPRVRADLDAKRRKRLAAEAADREDDDSDAPYAVRADALKSR